MMPSFTTDPDGQNKTFQATNLEAFTASEYQDVTIILLVKLTGNSLIVSGGI